MTTFAATQKGYAALWDKAVLTSSKRSAAVKVAQRIIAHRKRYEAVQAQTGVPWWWIGAIHDREAAGSFLGVLHNGEQIIGKGVKTKLVPAGRGPFSSWEEAAVDALKLKSLEKIADWSISRQLFEAERFNGQGYFGRRVNSPYLWAATSLQQAGKYVADHKWSSTAWDQQLGVAAVLKAIAETDPSIMATRPPPSLPTTAGAGAVVIGSALAGLPLPVVLGAAAAVLVLLVQHARPFSGDRPMLMLKSILANWKTTSAGTGSVLLAVADILRQVATKQWDVALLYADVMAIAVGLGLISAKDASVTGGTKAQ